MPLHIDAWRAYLQRVGKPRTDLADRMHGRRNDEVVREWIGADLDEAEVSWHAAEKEKLFREMMTPRVKACLVPGIEAFLDSYHGLEKAVVSSAERPNIDLVLDQGGLRHHFSVVLDGQQVQRPKPYPDIYRKAGKLLGVAMLDCVIFEDSPVGVAAGLASGAKVVGVLTHPTHLEGVDLLVHDFHDPALPKWLEHHQFS